PQEYYREGLRAQAKDDLRGAAKGGRENTDARLKRPLWQETAGTAGRERPPGVFAPGL
ncbi:MAG: hypothetical protein H5T97_10760, partial [Firmicutes bacterium]|nr:hypothetical protein [Bacillota bacterium]